MKVPYPGFWADVWLVVTLSVCGAGTLALTTAAALYNYWLFAPAVVFFCGMLRAVLSGPETRERQ
jgi:hypothetical protein